MREFRKTRSSVIPGDFVSPYNVERYMCHNSKLLHTAARCEGASYITTCCKAHLNLPNPINVLHAHVTPTCLLCVLCKGCHVCQPEWISESTMRLGKWVTKDYRKLYPFEMDDTHLINSIKKLLRDEEHFKDNWLEWLDILNTEAKQRGLL